MKAKILFNDCNQKADAFINNEIIVNSLIDKENFDYAIRLYFEYDFTGYPKLTSFKITKLNGNDKYHYLFQKIDILEDNEILVKDLLEMIRIKEINGFNVAPTNDSLIKYIKDKLNIEKNL